MIFACNKWFFGCLQDEVQQVLKLQYYLRYVSIRLLMTTHRSLSLILSDWDFSRLIERSRTLLGRVDLVAQRPIVVKLSRGRYVGLSVWLSSALWQNGGSDPYAVWHHRSDGSRDEAGSGVWDRSMGRGTFWGEFGARHCNQWGLYGVCVQQRRDAALFPNYFGQTCLWKAHSYFDSWHFRDVETNVLRCFFRLSSWEFVI